MDEASTDGQLSSLAYFGNEVREARNARKMHQKHLAEGTRYSVPYVSKVENGVLLASERFAERCDTVFGTNGLFKRLRRRIDEMETPSWFVPYLKLEPKACRILDFSLNCLIGVLQTEEYAQAILRAGYPHDSARVIEGRVKSRMQRRRDALEREAGPVLWAVLHEACLRIPVGGPAVMARQLQHLVKCAETPRIDLQVLPFSAGAPAAQVLSFTLLTFSDETPTTLWTDGPMGGRLFQAEATVANMTEVHERLRAHALSPDESLNMIRTISEELR
jgi:transcriptional regulator with XRE-family HTH domain